MQMAIHDIIYYYFAIIYAVYSNQMIKSSPEAERQTSLIIYDPQ
jgi:hypothetical protein